MKTKIITLTPELARHYISRSDFNRKTDTNLVAHYADQIKKGEWILTGQGISISKSGDLIDGKHRCHAVILANKSIETLIIYDLSQDTFSMYDTGKKRNASDVLFISKVASAPTIATIIRKYASINKGLHIQNGFSTVGVTNSRALDLYNNHASDLDYIVRYAFRLYKKNKLMSVSDIGAIYFYLLNDKGYDLLTIESFFNQLFGIEPVNLIIIDRLRDVIIKNISSQYKLTTKSRMAYIIKAWNAYVKRDRIKRLSYDPGSEQYPEFI
jgi:hypothetical protein